MSQAEFEVPAAAQRGFVTVGNFDGVHLGHQHMLAVLQRIAEENAAPAVVVTFDPHPLTLLKPDSLLPRLTTIAHRCELLGKYGADEIVILPVTLELLRLTPDLFFDRILCHRLKAAGVVEGPNFSFGRDRAGDVGLLADLCRVVGIAFRVIEPVEVAGELISSSRIRDSLGDGQVREAVGMIGHAHRISGTVARGAGRGRDIGYPTANLENVKVMVPGHGVYAGTARLGGERYVVAVSIGPNPTFGDDTVKIECHLDKFDGDLYGRTLEIDLLSEIRSLQPFDSAEELKRQIAADVQQCREQVARHD